MRVTGVYQIPYGSSINCYQLFHSPLTSIHFKESVDVTRISDGEIRNQDSETKIF